MKCCVQIALHISRQCFILFYIQHKIACSHLVEAIQLKLVKTLKSITIHSIVYSYEATTTTINQTRAKLIRY